MTAAGAMLILLASCGEPDGLRMTPDQLVDQLDGRNFESLAEVEAAFTSRGYQIRISDPENSILLPNPKFSKISKSDIQEGRYILLKADHPQKVYRFVSYLTKSGYYLQADIGNKNPYQK